MIQAIAPTRAAAAKKIALLVENQAYPEGEPAKGGGGDAAALAALLRRDGFEVELATNASRQELPSRVDAFVARVTPGDTALVYFKGIGLQVTRLTYLIPVDASLWSEDDVRREGTSLERLMADLDRRGARIKIAVVDAARPNPFERRFRMYSAGLAPVAAPQGSLVIFAEALNTVGDPGAGSPFMTELVKQLDATGDAETAFSRTREGVAKASNGRQLPWVASTLAGPFDLRAPATAAAPQADHVKPSAAAPKPPSPIPPPPAASKPPGAPPAPHVADTSEKPPVAAPTAPKPATSPAPPESKPAGAKPAHARPRLEREPRVGSTFSDCPRCPEMTVLAAASFKMGSGTTAFDRPVHKVTIAKPFAIARTVVTRDEWALCVDAGACEAHPDADGPGDRPVVGVTWSEASRYAAFLAKRTGKAYRLPTEAEWEYAARGGTASVFAWGDAPGTGNANCADCGTGSPPQIQPVKRYPKNGFGLFDMAGNVAQWLQDCWTLTYREAPADGSAPRNAGCKMRVVRGGSFETTSAYIKPTARSRSDAETRSPSIGFRVARDVR